ncbi:Crp/Fnr family transcriptional regulator [Desulfobulbus alkaliphilus]|uniref:Crp/Fnr family transcriptional regulator n=1 Tax=Desulfobulbus alkaliphilus TaxID=869814 RepID=UPI00196295B9|nr:Crp/Fnr family transcriptional regulator [Desulfobulbus alkaliphilus]MBM9538712.1 Crp/Fnr family transcriptional regulator [Desulfobulbus alkaliphilus]
MKKRRPAPRRPVADSRDCPRPLTTGRPELITSASPWPVHGDLQRQTAAANPEERQALEASPLLHPLSRQQRGELITLGSRRVWSRGQTLYKDGDPVEGFYFLCSGKVREFYSDGSGIEFLRRLVLPGHFIALHNMFNRDRRHTNNCKTLTAATAWTWPISPFIEFLHHHPSLGMAVAAALSQSYEQICRRHCLCRKPVARCRVAGYLLSQICLDCAHPCADTEANHEHCLDLSPLGHAAEEIHLARETFTRALMSLQEQGILTCNRGKITIHNVMALKNICAID